MSITKQSDPVESKKNSRKPSEVKPKTKIIAERIPKKLTALDIFTSERNQRIHSQLDWFEEQANMGYSEYNFGVMAGDFVRLSKYLNIQEYHELGKAWRLGYTEAENSKTFLSAAIATIKNERFIEESSET